MASRFSNGLHELGQNIKEFFDNLWSKVKNRFKEMWENADKDLLEFSILVTKQVEAGLQSGDLQKLVSWSDTKIDDNIVASLNANIQKLIASEMLLKTLQDNPTEDEVRAASIEIIDSWAKFEDADREQFVVNLSAKIYQMALDIKHGKKVGIAEAITVIKGFFDQYKLLVKKK